MPSYDYQCMKCKKSFTRVESISSHGRRKPACPNCKSRAVERIYGAFYAKTIKKS